MTQKADARSGPGASKPGGFEADNTPEICHLQQAGRTARETADDYPGIVARLCDTRRVIQCRDAVQWILQGRDGWSGGTARWTGLSYCRTREAILRLCRTSSARIDPIAWAALTALPAHFNNDPIKPAPIPATGQKFVRMMWPETAGYPAHATRNAQRANTRHTIK
jgi:hypothetical protein